MNEIHAVKTIQKISGSAGDDGGNFDAFRDRWCSMTAIVPPFGGPGTRPDGMTPAQTATYDNQLQPENQWIFRPAVDGCAPTQPVVDRTGGDDVNLGPPLFFGGGI